MLKKPSIIKNLCKAKSKREKCSFLQPNFYKNLLQTVNKFPSCLLKKNNAVNPSCAMRAK